MPATPRPPAQDDTERVLDQLADVFEKAAAEIDAANQRFMAELNKMYRKQTRGGGKGHNQPKMVKKTAKKPKTTPKRPKSGPVEARNR